MKKYITLCSLFLMVLVFSQSATYQEVASGKDADAIEQFIKTNPKHPNNGKLRYLLIKIRREQRNKKKRKLKAYDVASFRERIAEKRKHIGAYEYDDYRKKEYDDDFQQDENKSYSSLASKKGSLSKNNTHGDKDTELLNHLFSTSKNKKKAYIQIKNKSNCLVKMKVRGRKNYALTIPPKTDGHLLVLKGSYELSGTICKKKYVDKKKVTGDMVMSLTN